MSPYPPQKAWHRCSLHQCFRVEILYNQSRDNKAVKINFAASPSTAGWANGQLVRHVEILQLLHQTTATPTTLGLMSSDVLLAVQVQIEALCSTRLFGLKSGCETWV